MYKFPTETKNGNVLCVLATHCHFSTVASWALQTERSLTHYDRLTRKINNLTHFNVLALWQSPFSTPGMMLCYALSLNPHTFPCSRTTLAVRIEQPTDEIKFELATERLTVILYPMQLVPMYIRHCE